MDNEENKTLFNILIKDTPILHIPCPQGGHQTPSDLFLKTIKNNPIKF